MRIFAATPLHVGPEELARRADRYRRISPDGIDIDLHDLPGGAPRSLESPADITASEQFVVDALSDAPAHYDALLPDCVLDPGVTALQHRLDRPVIGIMKTNLAHAAALAAPTAAVVRNQAIADEFRRVADSYGATTLLTDVGVLDLDFDAIAHGEAWQQRLAELAAQLAAAGATSLFNGCSAVDTDTNRTSAIPVYDPVARALRLIAAGVMR